MRKLTKKLNNNTFVGSDVNGMEGGGPRFKRFKAKMGKAGRSMKSGIITGARRIRSGSKSVGKGFKWAGRSFKKKMSKVRQTLHKPFKNQSLAKKQSRVQKRTTKLGEKTESRSKKINEMNVKSQEYQKSINVFEKSIKNNPNDKHAEKKLKETRQKLNKITKERDQQKAKLTKEQLELTTSKGKLNNYTKKLEKKATNKTNNTMKKYIEFNTKGKWGRRWSRLSSSNGRKSHTIRKALKKSGKKDQINANFKEYNIKKSGTKDKDGKVLTLGNKNATMNKNSQKSIRQILADRKAKQTRFTSKGRRKRNDLVKYLKNNTTSSKILETAAKANQQATNLIKNSELRSQINKSYSNKAKLLSKQSKNTETIKELEQEGKKTAYEKIKLGEAKERDEKRNQPNNRDYLIKKLEFRKERNEAFKKNPNLNQEVFKAQYHTRNAKEKFGKDFIERRNDYKMAKNVNLISSKSKREILKTVLNKGNDSWNTDKFKRYKELKNKGDKSIEENQQFKELEEKRSEFKDKLSEIIKGKEEKTKK